MGLETLWEAVKFVEEDKTLKSSQEKIDHSNGNNTKINLGEISSKIDSTLPIVNNKTLLQTSNPAFVTVQPNADIQRIISYTKSADSINKDVNNNSNLINSLEERPIKISSYQITDPLRKNSDIYTKSGLIKDNNTEQSTVVSPDCSNNESKVSRDSNMDPLLARARAAVESASFDQKDGVLITPPRNIHPPALHLPPHHGVVIAPHNYPGNGSVGLPLKQSYYPCNATITAGGSVAVLNNQTKQVQPQPDKTVSILPSLKASFDSKTYDTLQIKRTSMLKRNVTLTHNQLEKNRRAHLKECFEALKGTIPRLGMRRSSNLTILKAAFKQIQVLRRKSLNHQQTITRLAKERDERRRRESTLMEELLLINSKEKIEKIVAETIRSGISSLPPLPAVDTGQLSTSTASEAEEEEYRSYNEILFPPEFSQQYPNEAKPAQSLVIAHVNEAPFSKSADLKESQSISSTHLSSTPSFETLGDLQIVETEFNDRSSPSPFNTASSTVTVPRHQPSTCMTAKNKVASTELEIMNDKPFSFKRSPNKSQPSRRSATPTPSSDFVQFFPRFSVGSGGSPPLMTSPVFDFIGKSTKVSEKQQDAHRRTLEVPISPKSIRISSNAVSLSSTAVESMKTSSYSPRVSRNASDIDNGRLNDQGTNRLSSPRTTVNSTMNVSNRPMSAVDTVIVTSFSGYEVKVKYLNTIADSIANTSSNVYRARMPVKKRPLNMESFASTANSVAKARISPSNSATSTSELQLTSLYVGASASVLGAPSKTEVTYTSDHESDRELPFIDTKRTTKYPHWRKNILNAQTAKESREKTCKLPEKPAKIKMFQVHPYEVSEPKAVPPNLTKSQEVKRKTTFNLWDRKHHAITPTSSLNWRGKQQLITSKPKASTSSYSAQTDVPVSTLSASESDLQTKVSYSILQKSTKPTVHSTIVVSNSTLPNIIASTAMDSTSKLNTVVQQDPSKLPTTIATSDEIPPLSAQNIQPSHPGSFQIFRNPISYQIIQSHATAPTSFVPYSVSSADNIHSISSISQSSATTLHASTNITTIANTTALNRESLPPSDTSALIQQPASMQAGHARLQIPQVPYLFPFSYIVYPPAPNGIHFSPMQQSNKVLTQNNTAIPLGLSHIPSHSPSKPPASPAMPIKPPSRNQSNESAASSTTLSADSTDLENKSGAKRARLSDTPLSSSSHSNVAVISPQQVPRMAQPQFFLPGNPGGFMVPASNGYSLPLNFFSYPIQAFPSPGGQNCVQAVPMVPGQPLQSISHVWPINQGILPSTDVAAEFGTATSNSSGSRTNLLTSSLLRSSKVD